ncbi:MAG: class I SAM-dependent methyltransferase [Anaerolineaceae bacterium]|nr:class I SAM-dependent methyltransferase [Anaerolineaceae bacterium]
MNPVSMDTVRADFDRLAGVESAGWNHNNHYHPFLLRHLPPHIGQALEIGCGKGAFSRLLADRAEHVVAIDLSGEMLGFAQAASAAYTNIDYRQCDVLEWDIPRESFDCIATIATLHHLPLEPVFLKVRDVLKPGGVLLVLDLYTAQTPMDYLWGAAGIPVSRLLKVLKRTPRQSQAVREAWEAHSAHDSYPALAEVRAAADLHLPGAQVRRHLLWRYSLVWRKP